MSILVITALGVSMMTGLYAATLDMYYSADRFFDRQQLFDIRILSPAGLTEEDVKAVAQLDGVEIAEGGYSQTVHTDVDGAGKSAEMTVLSSKGLNMPYLLLGTLPAKEGEIAVTQKYVDESGKSIGDTLAIEAQAAPNMNGIPDGYSAFGGSIASTVYTITAVVMDSRDIASDDSASAFRSTAAGDYAFFVTDADVNSDIFTAIYMTLVGTREMNSYSAEYEQAVQTVIRNIEGYKDEAKQQKTADADAERYGADQAQWYVQDRTSLESYSSLDNDLSSIKAVGKAFPVVFLLVAVLMSLTAMTRMVEEERGLIGTYTALGYGSAAVYGKYMLFAFMACLLGGILGDVIGFVFVPRFVAVVLETLYNIPEYYLRFDLLYGVGGILLFMMGVVGATVLACRSELAQMPAALMRPKAPRAGTRVIMERIPSIWNQLNFLNKVTVRNLFRYKKRLFMTVGGITGCTALILCGFAIKDSIVDLEPKQYGNVYQYDLMAVFQEDGNDDLIRQLSADDNIDDFVNLRIDSVKVVNAGGEAEKVQLIVIPDGAAIEQYIRIENLQGAQLPPDDNGIFITQNAAQILALEKGDSVSLEDMGLVQRKTVISEVVKNYLGNNVYMSQRLYETVFGEYVPNGVLAHLSNGDADHAAYSETLLGNGAVLSAVSTAALKEDFGFDLINAVVLLITFMAGGLAFVVLFTLSNTNISERARELATIKVLGFYDNEVHQYVHKETMLLTAAGILIGLPAGRIISEFLTIVLKMPSIYFAVHVETVSYLLTAAITFCFAVIVNVLTNRTLNRINMVEALKSVE